MKETTDNKSLATPIKHPSALDHLSSPEKAAAASNITTTV